MEVTLDQATVHYLDSAATVYPKPKQVLERMVGLYLQFGVNPGLERADARRVLGPRRKSSSSKVEIRT